MLSFTDPNHYYFVDNGTDIDCSDGYREICSVVSNSLVDDGGQTSSGITSRSFPSTSNISKGTCCTAGVINQPTIKKLLSKIKKICGSGTNVHKLCLLPSWYKTMAWIHSHSKSLRMYYYWQEAYKLKLTVTCTKAEPAFTVTVFSNTKKT